MRIDRKTVAHCETVDDVGGAGPVVTAGSVDRLGVEDGEVLGALIKATDVMVEN